MTKSKKGFTIIEVVLVLAIAGLIFLMVFIALPALQRGQRNTQRKNDMSRIMSALTEYRSNNSGMAPCQKTPNECNSTTSELANFIKRYLVSDSNATIEQRTIGGASSGITTTQCYESFCDPDGTPYALTRFYNWSNEKVGTDSNGTKYFEWSDSENWKTFYTNAKNGHEMMLAVYAKCDSNNEGRILQTSGVGSTALLYVLEGGAVTCVDNQ